MLPRHISPATRLFIQQLVRANKKETSNVSTPSFCEGNNRDRWILPTKRQLTHWGRVTHICVSKLTTIGSDNGLSPGRRQATIWTNAGILLIGTLETNFSEILIECHSFSFKKMHMKMSSGKWRPSRLGLNVLSTKCFHVTMSQCHCDISLYRKTSNISSTLVGNKIADNSDVVGASPVGAAPTTSSFSTWHLASMDWAKTTARGYKKHLSFGIWCDLY